MILIIYFQFFLKFLFLLLIIKVPLYQIKISNLVESLQYFVLVLFYLIFQSFIVIFYIFIGYYVVSAQFWIIKLFFYYLILYWKINYLILFKNFDIFKINLVQLIIIYYIEVSDCRDEDLAILFFYLWCSL